MKILSPNKKEVVHQKEKQIKQAIVFDLSLSYLTIYTLSTWIVKRFIPNANFITNISEHELIF